MLTLSCQHPNVHKIEENYRIDNAQLVYKR